MKQILLAGSVLIALSASAHARNGLPETMVGQWCFKDGDAEGEAIYVRGECRGTDAFFTVQRNSYRGSEGAGCDLKAVRRLTSRAYVVDVYCDGRWLEKDIFKLIGQELQMSPIDRAIEHQE
jgi:hypothetical protein